MADASVTRSLDLLLVVDTTDGAAQLRARFFTEARGMLLDLMDLGFESIRMGIVSSDLGDGSGEVAPEHCSRNGREGVFETIPNSVDPDCARAGESPAFHDISPVGGLADAMDRLLCLEVATVGHGECPIQQPLAAAVQALQSPAGEEFRRPEAMLAVVNLARLDDCSLAVAATARFPAQCAEGLVVPVQDYLPLFDDLAGSAPFVLASALGFPEGHSAQVVRCGDGSDAAASIDEIVCRPPGIGPVYLGTRLLQLGRLLGDRGACETLCDGDIDAVTYRIAGRIDG